MYLLREGGKAENKVQLLGSGTILREVIAAADMLKEDFGIEADIWSAPGINQLRRDGDAVERWNMLHPDQQPRVSYVEQCLKDRQGPLIAATDYKKIYAGQIRPYVPQRTYKVLGTDGYPRSDTRARLRHHFEVDRNYVAVAALKALHDEQRIAAAKVSEAIKKYHIDPEKPNPVFA
jgi:pyruvate dehydrogenase E1 component